jgi:hypothetical protein
MQQRNVFSKHVYAGSTCASPIELRPVSSILLVMNNEVACNHWKCDVWEFHETRVFGESGSGDGWMDERESLRCQVPCKARPQ